MADSTRFRRLAILGGEPLFAEPLHVGRPNVADRARLFERLNGVLDRAWLTNDGPCVKEFEAEVCRRLGVRHCVAVCNGTVALEIAIRALGLTGEVIVPSMTFIATAHALQWQEITPVFADVDEESYTLDPAAVERMITPRTSGIVGVHLWGRPCDTDGLAALARRRGLRLMYDASHAFGCSHGGEMIGNFGELEVFSFHATKFVNTLEGGAIVTNDDELARKARLMRNFGFAGFDNVVCLGTNGKMNEFCAAAGLTSLEEMDRFIEINRRNYQRYAEGLSQIPGLRLLAADDADRRNYQYVVAEVEEKEAGLTRDELVRVLHAENILARRYFYPGCHRMEPYATKFPHAAELLPVTERAVHRLVAVPTGMTIDPAVIASICGVIRAAVNQARAVRASLGETVRKAA